MLKNLSRPNRIGATVKMTRMIQKAWPTGLSNLSVVRRVMLLFLQMRITRLGLRPRQVTTAGRAEMNADYEALPAYLMPARPTSAWSDACVRAARPAPALSTTALVVLRV